MKKVLIIAPGFPPRGGGGVIRATKMAKYLGNYGYKVWVLCATPMPQSIIDESLLTQIPDSVNIIRNRWKGIDLYGKVKSNIDIAASKDNYSHSTFKSLKIKTANLLKPVGKKLANSLVFPDLDYWWARTSFKSALDLIKKEGIDIIFSTNPPSAHLLALRLKKSTNVKWIADFRDPWMHLLYNIPFWRLLIESKWEADVFRYADAITTVTPSFARGFHQKYSFIKRMEIIYNGFDPEDYIDIIPEKDTEKFNISHAGQIYKSRSPNPIFKALSELIKYSYIPRNKIQIQFAGGFHASAYLAAQTYGLTDLIKIRGAIPHSQALSLLKGSDLLLLIGDSMPGNEAYIPGKLFEYIALKRPICALAYPGEIKTILDKYSLSKVLNPEDSEGIKKFLVTSFNHWTNDNFNKQAEKTKTDGNFKLFDRRFQAKQLAELMNEILKCEISS